MFFVLVVVCSRYVDGEDYTEYTKTNVTGCFKSHAQCSYKYCTVQKCAKISAKSLSWKRGVVIYRFLHHYCNSGKIKVCLKIDSTVSFRETIQQMFLLHKNTLHLFFFSYRILTWPKAVEHPASPILPHFRSPNHPQPRARACPC